MAKAVLTMDGSSQSITKLTISEINSGAEKKKYFDIVIYATRFDIFQHIGPHLHVLKYYVHLQSISSYQIDGGLGQCYSKKDWIRCPKFP